MPTRSTTTPILSARRRVLPLAMATAALLLASCSGAGSDAEPVDDTDAPPSTASGPEFIELEYEETSGDDGEMQLQLGACTTPVPGEQVCEYEISNLTLIGNYTGRTKETRAGTFRSTTEPCTGPDESPGTFVEDLAEGTIVTEVGDEFYFDLDGGACSLEDGTQVGIPGTWTVTGGTGRFEDASGTMTATPKGNGRGADSRGLLRVRADRWPDDPVPVTIP